MLPLSKLIALAVFAGLVIGLAARINL